MKEKKILEKSKIINFMGMPLCLRPVEWEEFKKYISEKVKEIAECSNPEKKKELQNSLQNELKYYGDETIKELGLYNKTKGKIMTNVEKQIEQYGLAREIKTMNDNDRVFRDYRNIEQIYNPSEETCMVALQRSISAIKYIEKQTEEMQLFVIEKDYRALEYLKTPSFEVCFAAYKQNKDALSLMSSEMRDKIIIK